MFQHLPSIDPADKMLHFVASDLDHSCCFSRSGNFVHANSVLCESTGYTTEDLIGHPLLSFIHPDDADKVAAATGTWGHGPGAHPVSARFSRKSGGYCWLKWWPFGQASGGVFCATVLNVTEERRLRALAAELEVISEVGTWEIDLDTQFLYWSPVTFRIHDLDPGTYTPKVEDGLSFYPEAAHAEISAAVSALMTTGTRFDLELPFVTATGRRIWVRSTAAADIIGGKITRVYGTFRDITEKRAQREHLLRLNSAIQLARTTVILCGVDRRIEWVIPAFEELSGYSLAEARGRTVGSLVQCDKTDRDTIREITAALDAQREFNGEILNRSKNGREYWIHLNIQPLRDAQKNLSGFMAVTVDITERRAAEALRDLAEKDARRAEESLRSAVEVLPDAFALYDKDDRLVVFNERYLKTYARSAKAIVPGARFEDILRYGLSQGQYPEAIGREADWLEQRLQSHLEAGIIQEQQLDNDNWVRVVEQKTPSGGRVGLRIDISELKERERRLSEIIRGTNVGTWEWNVKTGETIFNERWAEIVGYTLAELQPTTIDTWLRFAHPDDLEVSRQKLEQHWRGELDFYDTSARMRHRDGHWVWVLDRGRVGSWTPDGKPLWMFGTHQDITSSKQAEGRLRREAWHDPLTGLTNRARFMARVSDLFNDPNKAERLIVLALDLDGFKAVNDTLGHPVGDQVLKNVAKTLETRLQSDTRLGDHVVARFGGDVACPDRVVRFQS